jgi:hypothetical protein
MPAPSRRSADILFFSTEVRKLVERIPARPYTADGVGPGYEPDEVLSNADAAPPRGIGEADSFEPLPTDHPHSYTVLRATYPREALLTKEFTKDRKWISYGGKGNRPGAFLYSARTIDVVSLDALEAELRSLDKEPRCCFVAGAIIEGSDRSNMRRIKEPHKVIDKKTKQVLRVDQPTLRDVPRYLLPLDVDSLDCPDGLDPKDLTAAAAHIRAQLPSALRNAACIAQATSGHCIKGGLRFRIFFPMDRSLTSAEIKAWMANVKAPVDLSIYGPQAVVYTAAPVFEDASHDPLPGGRIVRLDGAEFVTPPPVEWFEALAKPSRPPRDPKEQVICSDDSRKLQEALTFVPADDYEIWLKVGMALHWAQENADEPSDLGFELWDEWSQSADNYDAAALEAKWDSFDAKRGGAHGPTTVGYIFSAARENGYKDTLDDQTIRERIEKLHRETESFDKLSPEYKALKDQAIELFAKASDNYRGDPKERERFRHQWGMDSKTLDKRLREEDRKRKPEPGDTPEGQKIAELNKDHFVAYEGSRVFVFREKYDHVLKRRFYDRIRPKDFETAHENHRVTVFNANGVSEIGFGKYWLRHPERRQYLGGVVFDPSSKHRPDQFNLWTGFRVEPKKGSWKKFRKHLYRVVCRRDKRLFKYLIRWLANAVQHPEKQGEVVVVMRGGKGVGKGFLGRVMVSLFGLHGMHISNADHLVGKFNQHLQCCCMLFADEAFYAGDKKHIGILNRIVTEHSLSIEGKGKDIVESKNYIHLIMASNEDWVVPASRDERRYFVLDVSDKHKQDTVYFGAIQKELDSGGYEAMLHDLQRVDLSDFEVRNVPSTDALQDQKLQSLKTEEKWLHRILSQGYVRKSDFRLNSMETWHEAVTTDFLYESYERFAKENGARNWLSPVHFGRFMHDIGFTTKTQSRAAFHGEEGRGHDVRAKFNDDRRPAYRFGTLAQAREDFAKATGLALTWPEEGEFDGEDEEPPL